MFCAAPDVEPINSCNLTTKTQSDVKNNCFERSALALWNPPGPGGKACRGIVGVAEFFRCSIKKAFQQGIYDISSSKRKSFQ